MGIVVNIRYFFRIQMHFKASLHSFVAGDAVLYLFRVHSVELAHRRRGDAVLRVDSSRNSGPDAFNASQRAHEVEYEVAEAVRTGVFGVEVGVSVAEAVGPDFRTGAGLSQGQSLLYHQMGAYLGGEVAERLPVALHVTVYVKMVRVHRSYHGYLGIELEEGAVELVRLSHHHLSAGHQHIRTVVPGYASEEGGAAFAAVGQHMREQGAGGRLPVGSGYGEAAV